jgi:syntaxin 1B/2/3
MADISGVDTDGGQYDGGSQQPPIQPQVSNYSAQSNYSEQLQQQQPGQQRVEYVRPERTVMSNQDFLSRVEAVKADIRTLTTQVGSIASTHQRTLSSPESGSSQQLESIISQTQVLNTQIKDQIRTLEKDAVQSKDNNVKNTQINQLKTSFNKQLQEYRQEEASYEQRYREQIARQYRIVNPEASESEVREASNADWGNEGVFQTAVRTPSTPTPPPPPEH